MALSSSKFFTAAFLFQKKGIITDEIAHRNISKKLLHLCAVHISRTAARIIQIVQATVTIAA